MYPEGASPTLLEIIKRGEDKIDKRNTLIHIADVYGWEVANEYAGNVIGLNDMDNKKLEEAEKRVQKKKDKKAKEAQTSNDKKGVGSGSTANRKRTASEERKGRRSKSKENRYLIKNLSCINYVGEEEKEDRCVRYEDNPGNHGQGCYNQGGEGGKEV